MARQHKDWLRAFMEYASFAEAPKRMHFWTGVSTIAGVLQRKVWIDQAYFRWYPNFYIIMVAPPGIVSKSTTAGIGMKLLRKVKGVRFGPDVCTWQSLVTSFSEATEMVELAPKGCGEFITQSAITLESSEFGNLFNPEDREMVDLFVTLWDGKDGAFEKHTKGSGKDTVENPWINMIACTTPAWIAGNFPEYIIGGGFTSRCIFVYADRKEKFVAYPKLHVAEDFVQMQESLIADLQHISEVVRGEYHLTPEAVRWGEAWYEAHYSVKNPEMSDERFGGYLARKQSHIHKLAMVIAASCSDELFITAEHLALAATMTTDLEQDMKHVFSKIGKSEDCTYADRLVQYVKSQGRISYALAYRHVHSYFPSMRDFEDVLAGCVRAGYLRIVSDGAGGLHLEPVLQKEKGETPG